MYSAICTLVLNVARNENFLSFCRQCERIYTISQLICKKFVSHNQSARIERSRSAFARNWILAVNEREIGLREI